MSQLVTKTRRETTKHLEAFEAWYEAGRSFRKILQVIAVPERTLYQWAAWFGWHERADQRDWEIARVNEQNAIQERAQRLDEQRRIGTMMRRRAMEFFIKNPIKTESGAVAAARVGVELERQADALPDLYVRIAQATSIEELEAIEAQLSVFMAAGENATDRSSSGDDTDQSRPIDYLHM